MTIEDVRKHAAAQGVAEEKALAKGLTESSAANRSGAEIASHTSGSQNRGKWTIRRIAREGGAHRSQMSKEFVETGAQGYATA